MMKQLQGHRRAASTARNEQKNNGFRDILDTERQGPGVANASNAHGGWHILMFTPVVAAQHDVAEPVWVKTGGIPLVCYIAGPSWDNQRRSISKLSVSRRCGATHSPTDDK